MKPSWLKIKLPQTDKYRLVKDTLRKEKINTICVEANCPNRIECWEKQSMTFMILGDVCTRNCKFCAVHTGNPNRKIDDTEPDRMARVIKELGLSYIVITSVTRDDLADGGASVFAKTIQKIRTINPNVRIEVLVPDFSGVKSSIERVINAGCDVFSHNVETVERLTPVVRDRQASYRCSLSVLKTAHEIKEILPVKSGIMLGLGETQEEVQNTIRDLFDTGVSILTIGQYLQPDQQSFPVQEYINPEQFQVYQKFAINMGFKRVSAGPLVRSSYEKS
jgi:lipoic acid synthetase